MKILPVRNIRKEYIGLGIMAVFVLFLALDVILVKIYNKQVVGIIIDARYAGSVESYGYYVRYKYIVNGKKYINREKVGNNKLISGDKIVIKYFPPIPSIHSPKSWIKIPKDTLPNLTIE